MSRRRSRSRSRSKDRIVLRLVTRLAVPTAAAIAGLWGFSGFFDNQPYVIGPPHALASNPVNSPEIPRPDRPDPPDPAFVAIDPIPEDAPPRQASEAGLDTALAAALSASGTVHSRAVISRFGVVVAVSARLPESSNGFGDYVNIRLTFEPGADGLEVSRMAVGRYEIPRKWIDPALKLSIGWLPGADEAIALLAGIESVDPWGRTVTMAPGAHLPLPLSSAAQQPG